MHRTLAFGLFMVIATSGIALAQGQHQGTKADQDACGPDARRFCRNQFGDDFQVLNCLKDQERRLSNACHVVLEGYGQLQPRERRR